MKKDDKLKLIRSVGEIDDRFITEAAPGAEDGNAENNTNSNVVELTKKKHGSFAKWASIAASLLIVGGISAAVLLNGNFKGKDNLADTSVTSKSYSTDASTDASYPAETSSKAAESSATEAADDWSSSKSKEDKASKSDDRAPEINAPDVEYEARDKEIEPSSEIGWESEAAEPGGEGYTIVGDPDITEKKSDSVSEDLPHDYITNKAEAMLLTAGRWNDNANWGFFSNLVNNDTIAFPAYGLNPVNRVAVTVNDEQGNTLSGLKVVLRSQKDREIAWSAVTDKNGRAYLFVNSEKPDEDGYSLEVYNKEQILLDTTENGEVHITKKNEQGQQTGGSKVTSTELTLTVEAASKEYSNTQVMFIVDTTGSMGDELAYLQKDFSKIVEDVSLKNVTYSANFYRDDGDDYVTKCNDFTSDIAKVQSQLNNEVADGGGDTPEAVAIILRETITNNTNWSEDSVKIAFLVFDAPPHDGTEKAIIQAAKTAAEQGIHLIPVVASNADRDTELFGRALAIMTDGDYVFLTDDSGIGSSHLEPIIGDYEVEKLHDIIVKLIEEYGV